MPHGKQDDPLTYKIIGCCMTVHRRLGPGFEELIYQRALGLELLAAGLDYSREVTIPVWYEEMQVGVKRLDFVIDDCVVELKATGALEEVHFVQTLSYLKATGHRIALLVNFGAKSLQVERVINSKTVKAPEDR